MPTPKSTCWTVVLAAAAGSPAGRDELARRYLGVVRAYLAARWRGSPAARVSGLPPGVIRLECVSVDEFPEGERMTEDEVATSRGVHARSVRRWMRYGAPAAGGRTVKLAYRRVNGRYVTTRAWLGQFLAGLDLPDPNAAP